MKKINKRMTVKEAAEFLGVSRQTLKGWEKAGKLKAFINPMNKYHLYKKEDLKKVLASIKKEAAHEEMLRQAASGLVPAKRSAADEKRLLRTRMCSVDGKIVCIGNDC